MVSVISLVFELPPTSEDTEAYLLAFDHLSTYKRALIASEVSYIQVGFGMEID